MSGKDDLHYYQEEEARERFIDETLKGISEEGVFHYLAIYGDAIDARIERVRLQAQQLKLEGKNDPALILAVTAIELTVRFLLVRPLIQAAFLSENWAELLTHRIVSGRTSDDRRLLPEILRLHGVDIAGIEISDGQPLWSTILNVYKSRDKTVHAGQEASEFDTAMAIEAASALRERVVAPIALKHGFTLDRTGFWHQVDNGTYKAIYRTSTPFE